MVKLLHDTGLSPSSESWQGRHLTPCCRLQVPPTAPDRAEQTVMATLGKVKLLSNLFSRTSQALGLGKKMQTVPRGKRGWGHSTGASSRVAYEVQSLLDAMDPQQQHLGYLQ